MIHTFGFTYSNKGRDFYQRESFWICFGRVDKKLLSNHSSEDNETDYSDLKFYSSEDNETNYSDSESFTDTMDDLEDIFAEFDGDFDEFTIFEDGYEADTEADTD